MDANDTASVAIQVTEEASDVIDLNGEATGASTSFQGWLLG